MALKSQPADRNDERPAVLGGEPLIPAGPPEWPLDDPAVAEALSRALADRSWGKYLGGNCDRLSGQLASYHGCEHVVLCSSGTAAVELALRGLKVGPGDEVVLAAYDFKANFQNILTLGAVPVLVDIAASNWNLDPTQLNAAINDKTRAIIVSHLHGGVVPVPQAMQIARKRGVPVIEDACQMPGARLFGRRAGMWGDVGVLSFGGSKLLTSGRGGAIVTNNAEIVQRVHLYTQRGNEAYPLSELQAAVVLPQLEQLDERNRRRAEGVRHLLQSIDDCAGLKPFENPAHDVEPGYYKVGLQYDPVSFGGLSRDAFSNAMRAEGIALDPGFRALHLVHSKRRFSQVGELKHATDADEHVLTLHHPVLLEPAETLDKIVVAIERIQRHAGEIARSASSR